MKKKHSNFNLASILCVLQLTCALHAFGYTNPLMPNQFKCELSSSSKDDEETRAFLGIRVNHCIYDGITGVYVVGFYRLTSASTSPANKAGIEEGDQLISLNGCEIKKASDVMGVIKRTAPGSGVLVQVRKKGRATTTGLVVKTVPYSLSMDDKKRLDIPLERQCERINMEQGKYYP